MKTIDGYQNKQVLILGLAKSGLAAAKLVKSLGAKVVVNDQKPYDENDAAQELEAIGIKVVCGHHPLELLDGVDVIIKNPGIPYSNPLLQEALKRKLSIITEVELAYQVSEAPFIGITGSNGKTTTTTLIYKMLEEDRKNPLIAGNIGTVACEVAQEAKSENVIVTELSSFQLMGIETFKPKISLFLNLFEAHLDYHGTKEEYAQAKANIFKNQTQDDFAVVNMDDAEVRKVSEGIAAQIVPFSVKEEVKDGAYLLNNQLYFCNEAVMNVKDVVLPGKHNLENILAAIAVVKLLGCSNEAIYRVLTTFAGVKHRVQYVTTINKRKFYNDSKATNILATTVALSAFTQPTILLAGGLDRGNEFDELKPSLEHVKAVITFGETAPKIERVAKEAGIQVVKRVDNVKQAVIEAYDCSEEEDVVLLSPACASWDQFKTFEERGDMFIKSVHKLK
ncbi:UDP-N-acetylmuramoyl-L-alanine--D-glutamate ligase [Priestia flexa]|uniref:UDP-N-acetylmuramoylalanine--D-glutamate ligase n=1 Tax=Priestia flexa TaxID=86664 RepID=A0A8I1SM80_9BACI|nr:UDP-N-acetylmuramoyl-L-alanine--D-glutamate ligase [Priestia flexa]MBN8250176.1 UDP-N-acetylmuramoyl-L-alanine--D-glutamate ligase [Priestia flexa]MBN8433002.1 UDP-N-acetylmuramoyl-L-alanine--D-glutamate ligase [Priestia flexa]MCA0965012.1 UDP-N-acetylmuramoyl-L-alanine--D-glutamate ligase [Priestia flexa]RIV15682.1 UDP-N-acetylmuramoyl-L-alanine--D-glutamate ligase [Priestia flexa]UIR29091.1 UDP-N-acetylmuramoyl-L-alanine--D-glutamate ligase [Priestia flexa]